jgi:flagellar hook-associated protein 3 FlgL
MRITDHRIVDMAAASAARNESRVGELSNEMSSGLRVAKPSDDPSAWLSAQRDRVRAALNDGTSEAISTGHDQLVASDGALSTLSGLISKARELAVEGSNDTQNASSRAAIGTELDSLFETAVSTANAVGANGEYLLGGTSSLTQPFDTATGAYTGDAVTRGVNLDTVSTQVATVAGSSLTATSGVDILPLLKTLATAMNSNNITAIRSSLTGLDTAVTQLAQLRGQTGGRMAVLESAKTAHADLATRITASISNTVEADSVATATDLAKASTALSVSQAVTTHVLQLLDPNK